MRALFYYLTKCHEHFFLLSESHGTCDRLPLKRTHWAVKEARNSDIQAKWHVSKSNEKKVCKFVEIWNWFDLHVSCSKNHFCEHVKCKVLQFVITECDYRGFYYMIFRSLVIRKHRIKVRFLDIQPNRKWNSAPMKFSAFCNARL